MQFLKRPYLEKLKSSRAIFNITYGVITINNTNQNNKTTPTDCQNSAPFRNSTTVDRSRKFLQRRYAEAKPR